MSVLSVGTRSFLRCWPLWCHGSSPCLGHSRKFCVKVSHGSTGIIDECEFMVFQEIGANQTRYVLNLSDSGLIQLRGMRMRIVWLNFTTLVSASLKPNVALTFFPQNLKPASWVSKSLSKLLIGRLMLSASRVAIDVNGLPLSTTAQGHVLPAWKESEGRNVRRPPSCRCKSSLC